jgi:FAD/FMN-containing dehydrogenase/Fe-S oxidoreductase
MLYSTDASNYQIEPVGVVLPKTAADLIAAVQIAQDLDIPITARGGGTSLTGQSIGPGLVLDCSKYLNQIGDVDTANRTVKVRPGVVLEHLNRHLTTFDLHFGPDVATANRATLGGMIGNNSAGARSIVYGQTVDHVRSLDVVLADGTPASFGPLSPTDAERKRELRTREGEIYREVDRVLRTDAEQIVARFPKILRKVSGYNLLGVLPPGVRSAECESENQATVPNHSNGSLTPQATLRAPHSLVPLLVGSEGTLAVVTEAELFLVPRPQHRGLLVPHFDSLRSALDALAVCLSFGPSAVELMDTMLIELARNQRSLKGAMAAISGRPAALLMVEFTADDPDDVTDKVEKLAAALRGASGMTAAVTATDPHLRDPLWNLRSAAVPLLYGMPGDKKPVTFVEDCAVDPDRLPEFATRFRDILKTHGTDGAFYGHASVGCLHIRPVLNLHDPADVVKMRAITEDVTDLVLQFHGSLSGEHGDGLVRSEWNRKMFGDRVYEAFRTVKRAFDPANVLNPGKVVDGPAMEANFRLPPGTIVPEPPTVLDYTKQGGFFRSIELCNGAGVCRKTQGGTMCPSYRATKDERDTTRARANSLRLALSQTGSTDSKMVSSHSAFRTPHSALSQRWIGEVMDLCLSCKACKAECPSNVDVAKLKAEYTQAYYAHRPRPVGHRLVKNVHRLSPWGAALAGPLNWLGRRAFARGMMEALAGFDRRRSLPELHAMHFRRWFAGRRPAGSTGKKVLLLDDCFTTYQEPRIGQAAVKLLEAAGYAVELANVCCGRAMISKGYLTDAQKLARTHLPRLAKSAAAGTPILGLEPSCLLTLSDEWPELVPGPDADRVAAAAELVESWIARQVQEKAISMTFDALPNRVVFHGHCHQKALVGVGGTTGALGLVPGLTTTVLDAGCCGMAGAFGYETEHYDLSVKIANLALLPGLAADPLAVPVATGTSCRHQIRDLTGRTAFHPVEVLASAVRT